MPFGRKSWCLVTESKLPGTQPRLEVVRLQKALPTIESATDAVSVPATRDALFGGSHGALEGSIPSSATEHHSGAPS